MRDFHPCLPTAGADAGEHSGACPQAAGAAAPGGGPRPRAHGGVAQHAQLVLGAPAPALSAPPLLSPQPCQAGERSACRDPRREPWPLGPFRGGAGLETCGGRSGGVEVQTSPPAPPSSCVSSLPPTPCRIPARALREGFLEARGPSQRLLPPGAGAHRQHHCPRAGRGRGQVRGGACPADSP